MRRTKCWCFMASGRGTHVEDCPNRDTSKAKEGIALLVKAARQRLLEWHSRPSNIYKLEPKSVKLSRLALDTYGVPLNFPKVARE